MNRNHSRRLDGSFVELADSSIVPLPLLRLSDVPQYVRARHKHFTVKPNAVRNWTRRGVLGIKLHAVAIGSRVLTSGAWVDDFLERLASNPRAFRKATQCVDIVSRQSHWQRHFDPSRRK